MRSLLLISAFSLSASPASADPILTSLGLPLPWLVVPVCTTVIALSFAYAAQIWLEDLMGPE